MDVDEEEFLETGAGFCQSAYWAARCYAPEVAPHVGFMCLRACAPKNAEKKIEDKDRINFEDVEMFKTRWIYTRLLESKSELDTLPAIQSMIGQVESEVGARCVYRVHSDQGQEFLAKNITNWLTSSRITHTTTEGYDPKANGGAEEAVGALKRTARSLLSGASLSTLWWGRAVVTASIYHRRLAKGIKMPTLNFGSRCMMRTRGKEEKDDFAPIAVPALCLGPSETIPGAYVMFKETDRKIETTGNVQIKGKRANLNENLFDVLTGPADELSKFESPHVDLEPLLPKRWTCPACRGHHRAHNRIRGLCSLAENPADWIDEFAADGAETARDQDIALGAVAAGRSEGPDQEEAEADLQASGYIPVDPRMNNGRHGNSPSKRNWTHIATRRSIGRRRPKRRWTSRRGGSGRFPADCSWG